MFSITNEEIENIYNKQGKCESSHSKCALVCEILVSSYDQLKYEDKIQLTRKIERTMENRSKVRLDAKRLEAWRRNQCLLVGVEGNKENSPPNAKGAGRKKMRLSDNPSSKTSNKILDSIVEYLESIANDESIPKHDLLQMVTSHCNKRWKLDKNQKEKKIGHTVEAATALIYNVDLSINKYQELRLNLKDRSFFLPTRNEIDIYKKTLLPPNICFEETKVLCPIKDVVIQTVSALIESSNTSLEQCSDLVVDSKFGLDGSGSHQKRHQSAEGDDSIDQGGNYIGAFWCPLEIKNGDNVIWCNPVPNSILYARPVCLMRDKETRATVLEHFKPILDELHQMEQETTILPVKQIEHQLSLNAEVSMIDGKMADILQGDSGAFCHYCDVSRKDANDMEKIIQGFPITKSFAQIKRIWEALESGELSYNDAARAGQCHESMLGRDLRFFAILHQKLRSLDHCLKLMYHLVSGQTHTWSETQPRVKDAIAAAKKEVIDGIKVKCQLLLDSPNHIGGNTNSGPAADAFFSPAKRKDICSLIRKTVHRESFDVLLGYFNKMLSITQSVCPNKIANPEKVKQLGEDLMVHYKRSFPWAMISPSVHQMCAHAWELFVITNGSSIAKYSEQSGESWNKHIRSFKSGTAARARQSSIKDNTQDIFTRMMIKSHPFVAAQKRALQCDKCNKVGHTVRSCTVDAATVRDAEQDAINDCYL